MTTQTSSLTKTATTSIASIKIKKENQEDEIKDFAETAMNELLGWYGYDGMEKLDLASKTLHTASLNSDDSSKNERNNKRNNNLTDNMNVNNTSRENSKSPSSVRKSDKQDNICGWCRREVPENSPEFLTTSNGFRYCSESCFAQSRRASFKKAKTCDWCRHVRHAVSYVDFQDEASQLQFCSDKCLNQYKMQIFCKETQEHLDMNPHLKEKGFNKGGGLITPELWLQNCRSRSISPTSELSRSPTPPEQIVQISTQKPSYKPIISVTPVSKLMSKNSSHPSVRHLQKHTRRRKSTKITIAPNNGCMSNDFLNLTDSGEGIKSKNLSDSLKTNINIATSSNFTDAQNIDFSISSVPPNNAAFHNIPSALSQRINLPQPLFPNPDKTCQTRHPFSELSVQNQQPGLASHSSLASTSNIHADLTQPTFLGSPMPPVTVMVPYPIIIPLPIPIPILLPIMSFIKAAKQENETSTAKNSPKNECSTNNSESSSKTIVSEPLDFTKSKASAEIQKIDKNSDKSKYILSSADSDESNISDQKLVSPKLKISRVCAKRIAKESEKSRPLRKRKRIIDYLRNSKNYDDNRHIK